MVVRLGITSATLSAIRQRMVRPPAKRSAIPPDTFLSSRKVKEIVVRLQTLRREEKLSDPEIRRRHLPDLVRYATDREAKIWERAFDLLQMFFKEELEQLTQVFVADIRKSKKVVNKAYRRFVARSPYTEKGALMELLSDQGIKWEALNNLLKRNLIYEHDLPALPPELLGHIAGNPDTNPEIREKLIYTDYADFMTGSIALEALKVSLKSNEPEELRKKIFGRYMRGSFVPLSVLKYSVENLKPTKDELLSLVGIGTEGGRKLPKFTAKDAAEIARRIVELYQIEEKGEEPWDDLAKISQSLPAKRLTEDENKLLMDAIKSEWENAQKSPIPMERLESKYEGFFVVTPIPSMMEFFQDGSQNDKELLLKTVTEHLIEKKMLKADDLLALAAPLKLSHAAEYILAKHPQTRVRQLLKLMLRKGPNDWVAFENLSENVGRHPMLTRTELLSWALRAQSLHIRMKVLKWPEILNEQLNAQLEIANKAIVMITERANAKGRDPESALTDAGWPTYRSYCLSRLLEKLPEKIVGFTRILMAIESGDKKEVKEILASYPMRHSAEPFSRKELDYEKEVKVDLNLNNLLRTYGESLSQFDMRRLLDIRQLIALLCEENSQQALEAWEYLSAPQNLKRFAMLSKRSVITWALHSRSLDLKRKIINEPEIIVEQLLALLSHALKELETEKDAVRKEKLTQIKVAATEALRKKIPQKVGSFIENITEVEREFNRMPDYTINHPERIGKILKGLKDFTHELNMFSAEVKSEAIKDIQAGISSLGDG